MTDKLNINQWAEEDRPREKMMLHGAAALTNAELLAILIGSGNTEDTAVELMRKVLDGCRNSLSELSKCTVDDLCRYKGIGPAKAVTILAASELGKRRKEEEPARRKQIRCSTDIYDWFHPLMCDLPVEECWIMLLNQASKVIDTVRISRGGLASTQVDVRLHPARSPAETRHGVCALPQPPVGQQNSQHRRRPPYPVGSCGKQNHEHPPARPSDCDRRRVL